MNFLPRRTFLAAAIAAGLASSAFAQGPEQKEFTVKLSPTELTTIEQALMSAPIALKDSFPAYQSLLKQTQPPPDPPPVAQAAPQK